MELSFPIIFYTFDKIQIFAFYHMESCFCDENGHACAVIRYHPEFKGSG